MLKKYYQKTAVKLQKMLMKSKLVLHFDYFEKLKCRCFTFEWLYILMCTNSKIFQEILYIFTIIS